MKKLIQYHTVMADVNHFWTNVRVGSALQLGEIKTYEEYLKCCDLHGVSPYNEETFNEFIGKIVEPQDEVTKKVFVALKKINPELQKLDKVAKEAGYRNYIDYVNAQTHGSQESNKKIETVKDTVINIVLAELKQSGAVNTSISDASELLDNLMDSLDGGEDSKGQVDGHIEELVMKERSIEDIVARKRLGIDCSESESSKIKGYFKDSEKVDPDLANMFLLEYSEVLNETNSN